MALNETTHAGEFILSEAPGYRSREEVTILSGQDLQAGAVLGKIDVGAATAAAKAGNTGNGTMGAITRGLGAKPGVYQLIIVEAASNAGAFIVYDPDGIPIGTGDVAAAFSAGGLAFTLADGSTDFAAGDGFDITVAAGSGKYRAIDADGTDGHQKAAGILYGPVDASGGDKAGVAILRDAEVMRSSLDFGDLEVGAEQNAAIAELRALGIIVREAI